jgi:hypothetical protein
MILPLSGSSTKPSRDFNLFRTSLEFQYTHGRWCRDICLTSSSPPSESSMALRNHQNPARQAFIRSTPEIFWEIRHLPLIKLEGHQCLLNRVFELLGDSSGRAHSLPAQLLIAETPCLHSSETFSSSQPGCQRHCNASGTKSINSGFHERRTNVAIYIVNIVVGKTPRQPQRPDQFPKQSPGCHHRRNAKALSQAAGAARISTLTLSSSVCISRHSS